MTKKKLLAIDNASRLIGWSFWHGGELHEYGVIDLSACGAKADNRIGCYWKELGNLFKLYEPDMVAIETPCGIGWSVRILSEYLGVVKCRLSLLNIPWALIAPTSAKKALTGTGKANKQEVQHAAHDKFPDIVTPDVTEDEADAIAIGYSYLMSTKKV